MQPEVNKTIIFNGIYIKAKGSFLSESLMRLITMCQIIIPGLSEGLKMGGGGI